MLWNSQTKHSSQDFIKWNLWKWSSTWNLPARFAGWKKFVAGGIQPENFKNLSKCRAARFNKVSPGISPPTINSSTTKLPLNLQQSSHPPNQTFNKFSSHPQCRLDAGHVRADSSINLRASPKWFQIVSIKHQARRPKVFVGIRNNVVPHLPFSLVRWCLSRWNYKCNEGRRVYCCHVSIMHKRTEIGRGLQHAIRVASSLNLKLNTFAMEPKMAAKIWIRFCLFSFTAIASELATPCESSSKSFCRSSRRTWIHGRRRGAWAWTSPARSERRSASSAAPGCWRSAACRRTRRSATRCSRCRTWSSTSKNDFRFSTFSFFI